VTPPPPASPPAAWGDPRSRFISWFDPLPTAEAGRAMSGLDFIRAIRDGLLAPPPMASVFDFAITEVEVGRVTFECTPDESAYNPIGVVHGGLVCTLADSVLGCAVQTTLEAGVAWTSLDLNVSYLRTVTVDSGRLRAVGTVTKPGRRAAFAAAEILDASGKRVASATGSCLIMDGRGPG
jgi:uncharacterized protein (TIGR00369 family)